ncbi:RNA polymerase sigma factor [Sedimenticola sp.]|uniref:RNA polymerase sigma factor n=1 Tax=Sedimenticola sp. TaxID=1940285 RepID=UPI003D11FB06
MPSFGQLISQQIPRLRRYARALLSDAGMADDLVQDCLERAWSKQRLWSDQGDIRPWLFSIMHNLHVNALRSLQRRPGHETLTHDTDRDTTSPEQPEQLLALHELEQALHRLPEKQRQVMLLVGLEQFSYEETASILGIPVGTVMSRLSRARENLRSALHGEPQPTLRRIK